VEKKHEKKNHEHGTRHRDGADEWKVRHEHVMDRKRKCGKVQAENKLAEILPFLEKKHALYFNGT
jgi:hypothetical protein